MLWHMPRTTPLLALIVLMPLTASAADPKTNVLFIMADDLRPELAAYGAPAITPNFDRLARRSLRFERAYCQQALCNPSRASMLTGLRPDTLGIWDLGTHFRDRRPDVVTLPEWFKQNGYQVRDCGKIFHNWAQKTQGDRQSWSAPEFLHFASHAHDAPQVNGEAPVNHATAPRCECRDVPDDAYYDGRVAAEAVKVLAEIKDKPFFLAVGFWKPHAPFNAPKKYWDLYTPDKLPPLNPARPVGAPDIAFHDSREILGAPAKRITVTPEQAAEMRHGYFANISYLDAQLGKVLDALDASGVADRTIIVFTSDHGFHLGEHGLWAKTSNFELDARVPLLIATPNMASAGKATTSLAELLDLYPTLVDLCELQQPRGLEGVSLTPVLKDPTAQVRQGAYTQHPRPAYYEREKDKTPKVMGVSVRTAAVRYTEWRDWKSGQTIATELYDGRTDPGEMKNAIEDPKLSPERQRAEQLLHQQFPRKER